MNKGKTSNFSGITLIALVITVIVLLILAGISISMLAGDNGILQKATEAKTQTGVGQEKETIALAYNSALAKKVGNGDSAVVTSDDLNTELANQGATADGNDPITVTFFGGRTYLIDTHGNISGYSDIFVSNLIIKDGDNILEENCKSLDPGKALTINFTASITEGSIISISPTLPYTTNGSETSKIFTITGTGGVTKQYTVDLSGYYNVPELKVGDYVNYALNTPTATELNKLNSDITSYSGATNNTTKTADESTLLCRVLEMDSSGNPIKLISADGVNTLILGKEDGYNNAVYLINEMCETLYSGNQGTTTSLTIEDLENRYFSDAAIATRDAYTSPLGGVQYGQTKYYSGNYAKYPNIAPQEAKMGIATMLVDGKNQIRTGGLGLSEQTITYIGKSNANASTVATTNKGITVTQTYYRINQGDSSYKNATLNNIMHKSPTANGSDSTNVTMYWLSSRCVDTKSDRCSFGIFRVKYDLIGVGSGFDSYAYPTGSNSCAVRPVITLNTGIQAKYSEKYNSTYNIWNLK